MDENLEDSHGGSPHQDTDGPSTDKQERQADKPPIRKVIGKTKMGPLPGFCTIGRDEKVNVDRSFRSPLSGYLGGSSRSGYWCERLSDGWCDVFGCQYSIPCNSATSGLLAACMAAEIGEGDLVFVSDYTMSASATCAIILGAEVALIDIDPVFFSMAPSIYDKILEYRPKAVIVTNLFGCPADLHQIRKACDEAGVWLIEDNAQAPFATIGGKYTGTIGHMGVFSLNVHKHIQCGEGGVIVTDDPNLAHKLDCAINHGELMRTNPHIGLNLRMTEPIAAIACAQLKKGPQIIQGRIDLAHQITDCFDGIPFVEPPAIRPGSNHVFYMWAGKIKEGYSNNLRYRFLTRLRARGIPFREGYSKPLHRILGSSQEQLYPTTTDMEDYRLFCFEICAHDPKSHHLKQMKQIIQYEASKLTD